MAETQKCGRCRQEYIGNKKAVFAKPEWVIVTGVAYIDERGYRRSTTNLCDKCIVDFRRFLKNAEVAEIKHEKRKTKVDF